MAIIVGLFIFISTKNFVLSQQNAFYYVKHVAYVGKRGYENLAHLITAPHNYQPNVSEFNRGGNCQGKNGGIIGLLQKPSVESVCVDKVPENNAGVITSLARKAEIPK